MQEATPAIRPSNYDLVTNARAQLFRSVPKSNTNPLNKVIYFAFTNLERRCYQAYLLDMFSTQEGGWTGDLLIGDWEQIENATANSDIYTKRFKAEEVVVVFKQDAHCFPIPAGDLSLPDDNNKSLIRRIGSTVHNKNKTELPGATHGNLEAADAGEAELADRPSSSNSLLERLDDVAPQCVMKSMI